MKQRKLFIALFALIFISLFFAFTGAQAQEGDPPILSAGSFPSGTLPRVILVDDPHNKNIKIPSDVKSNDLSAAGSVFTIDYVPAGGTDTWQEPCLEFPADAKAAFNAAAAIWAAELNSTVPITIKACWANLGDSDVLGYSGAMSTRDFSNAPKPNTWYTFALANSLAGTAVFPADYDMHITYNSNFSWYYGLDASPPSGEYDFVTVAAHEIAHGLNFSGMVIYSSTQGIGGFLSYPSIYDTFIEDGTGKKLTDYANLSAELGAALTSNNLWFDGPNAKAANNKTPVKIYAPATWLDGSSYSHLDYATFANTEHNMMVFSIGSGSANHNPGAVTLGIMADLGWQLDTPAAPSNDELASATVVTSPASLPSLDTRGATSALDDPEIQTCNLNAGRATVWYKYTHNDPDSAISINTETSNYDTFIAIWTKPGSSLEFIACNDDTNGTYQSSVAFQVKNGTTYYIEVGQWYGAYGDLSPTSIKDYIE